jgi:hypothetical protein
MIADNSSPLVLTNLPFARLMDDVVVPYQADEPFFIDGAPLTRQRLKKLKIVRQKEFFEQSFADLHYTLREGNVQLRKLYGEQYHVRLEALLREAGDDVTSQVIKAYDRTIKPSLKDYLPKREELISAALKLFLESIKALGS